MVTTMRHLLQMTRLLIHQQTIMWPPTTTLFQTTTGSVSRNSTKKKIASAADAPGAIIKVGTESAWTQRAPRLSTITSGTPARCHPHCHWHRRTETSETQAILRAFYLLLTNLPAREPTIRMASLANGAPFKAFRSAWMPTRLRLLSK